MKQNDNSPISGNALSGVASPSPTKSITIWRTCGQDHRPAIGSRWRDWLERMVRDDNGEPLGGFATGIMVVGTVAKIGAHWSDQPHGRAGYHVAIAVDVPDDGKEYC